MEAERDGSLWAVLTFQKRLDIKGRYDIIVCGGGVPVVLGRSFATYVGLSTILNTGITFTRYPFARCAAVIILI